MKMKKWMTQKAHQNFPKVSHGVNAYIESSKNSPSCVQDIDHIIYIVT